MNTPVRKGGKFRRFIKAPIRFLIGARDFYVKIMFDCASNVYVTSYASVGVMRCPTSPVSTSFSRSFSVNSSVSRNDDDFRELIRAASARCVGKKIEMELHRQKQSKQSPIPMAVGGTISVVPRSHTVAIFGRIDEDKPCDQFGEDIDLKTDHAFPRSRSHAITNRRAF